MNLNLAKTGETAEPRSKIYTQSQKTEASAYLANYNRHSNPSNSRFGPVTNELFNQSKSTVIHSDQIRFTTVRKTEKMILSRIQQNKTDQSRLNNGSLLVPSSLDAVIQEIVEKWIQLDVVLLQIREKLVQAKDLYKFSI